MFIFLFMTKDYLIHPKVNPFPFTKSQIIAQITCHLFTASAVLICVPPAMFRKFHC